MKRYIIILQPLNRYTANNTAIIYADSKEDAENRLTEEEKKRLVIIKEA